MIRRISLLTYTLVEILFSLGVLSAQSVKTKAPVKLDIYATGSYVVPDSNVTINLTLNHDNWIYKIGEEAIFTLSVVKNNVPVKNIPFKYSIGLEKMASVKEGNLKIKDNTVEIKGGTLLSPGFLRCNVSVEVDGRWYKKTATAAFEPEGIKPTATMPGDFKEFWQKAIAASRNVPLDVKLTPLPKRVTAAVNVYQVEYQYSEKGERFYGVLSIPKKEGRFPAVIRFPGAGVTPLSGDVKTAEKGFITLDLNIHSIPVNQNSSVYTDLQKNELYRYQFKGLSHRDSFYFKNVVLGCVRSVDMIYSLPQFNGKSVGAWGSSQGGALSIITTSLEPRINYLVVLCPALSDITGYLHGRAGGWPHIFNAANPYSETKEQVLKTIAYYDVVNFAKQLTVPGFYSWGFNDETTPPTSFYSSYNSIRSPKKVLILKEGEHKIYPEQREKSYAWLIENLLTK